MTRLIVPAAFAAAMGLVALPAAAQNTGAEANSERIMMVQIPVGGECPVAEDADTIVVCEEIEDPYRIPSQLRQGRSPENRSWADRVRATEDVGSLAPMACNNLAGGGEVGCSIAEIEAQVEARENAPERRFSLQIEQARAERLETIDADAARTQARVEELERAYLQRLEAERDAPLPGEEEPLPAVGQ